MDTEEFDVVAYAALAERLIKDFSTNPRQYPTPHSVVKCLHPTEACAEINLKVMHEANAHLKIKPTQFEAALRKIEASIKKDARDAEKAEASAQKKAAMEAIKAEMAARKAEMEARETAAVGASVTDARSFIHGFMATNHVAVRFDRDCTVNGQQKLANEVLTDALLTAESLGYTLGTDKLMSATNVKLAFDEHLEQQRQARKQAVLDNLMRAPDDPHIIQKFRDSICTHMFVDAELGCRAMMKVVWQVKRRLLGLYVEMLQMIVLYGPQFSGKSELLRQFFEAAIGEIAAECDMSEVCDDKNFQIRSNAMLFVDEMARADKADMNKLKNLITANGYSSRVFHSHAAQKIPLCLTLIGTVDKRLNTLIQDVAGMRRFVEIDVKPRAQQDGLSWQYDVVEFPWIDLWRAVDHTAADPLMTTQGDKVRAHQEDMRARTNTEAWVEQFQESGVVLNHKKSQTDTTIEFYADALYRDVFRVYEQAFHPGSTATSAITWGRTMKTLIEQGIATEWTWRGVGHNVVYTYARPKVTPMYGNGRDLVPVANDSLAKLAKLHRRNPGL